MILARFDQHLAQFYPQLVEFLKSKGSYREHLAGYGQLLQPYVTLLIADGWHQDRICERCMELMVAALGPSRYAYLDMILRSRHTHWHQALEQTGLLKITILDLLPRCTPLFSRAGFDATTSVFADLEVVISEAITRYRLALLQ